MISRIPLSEEETLYKYLALTERRLKRVSRVIAEAPGVACVESALGAYLPLVRAAIKNPQLYAEFQERAYKGEFLLEEYTGTQDALLDDGVARFWEDALSGLTEDMLAELNGDAISTMETTN
jgi:hypothetical protein